MRGKQARQVHPGRLHFSTMGDTAPNARKLRKSFGFGQRRVKMEDIKDTLSLGALARIERDTQRLQREMTLGATEGLFVREQTCSIKTDKIIEMIGQCTVGQCRVHDALYFHQVIDRISKYFI